MTFHDFPRLAQLPTTLHDFITPSCTAFPISTRFCGICPSQSAAFFVKKNVTSRDVTWRDSTLFPCVSKQLPGKGLQTGFSRHGLPPQRALLDTVYPLRKHLNSVQRMASGGCCEGLFPDTVCWTRLRNTWFLRPELGRFSSHFGALSPLN